ncbi:hypothetical protein T492DRAFT_389337 [Pavlovales sp. CCMP2436]|nr:hypothetical protein T492DRAFT_389337 [Pavlovales sp. CCMP2436]
MGMLMGFLLFCSLCAGAFAAPGRREGADGLIVIEPNRGDTWTKGGSYYVLWTSMRDDIALCSAVEISLQRGTQQPADTVQTENDGAHLFYVSSTVVDGDDYRIALHCAQPSALRNALAGHSGTFSVASAAEVFSVHSPAQGAVWAAGTEQEVGWTFARPVQEIAACDSVDILLIRRSAADQQLLSSMTVPASAGPRFRLYVHGDSLRGTYTVRVQCAGDTALGGESGLVLIEPTPDALELRAPEGAACLIGHACALEWSSSVSGRSDACAQLSGALVNSTRTVLAFHVANGAVGRFDLSLPGSLAPGAKFHFELSCQGDASVRASSSSFKVVRDEGALELTEPHAGSVWATGQTHTVRWLSSLGRSPDCAAVDVDLLHGEMAVAAWPAVPNSGALELYLPGSTAAGGSYRLRLSCAGDSTLRSHSAGFAVARDPTALELSSPGVGAHWTSGSVEVVRWGASEALKAAATCAHVDLTLYRESVAVLSARAPNSGRYALYVNGSLPPSEYYALSLECSDDRAVKATSGEFAIARLQAPFIIQAPNAQSECACLCGSSWCPRGLRGGSCRPRALWRWATRGARGSQSRAALRQPARSECTLAARQTVVRRRRVRGR